MLQLKGGVNPKGLQADTLLAIYIVDQVYAENGFKCVVTSINDGKHGKNSYHYDGHAFDVRVRNANFDSATYPSVDQAMVLAEQIRLRLGKRYDVIFGQDANHMDHMHIEFNARTN